MDENQSTLAASISLIAATLIIGLAVPSPVNLYLLGLIILASFAIFYGMPEVSPIVPALTTYVAAYFGIIQFCSPAQAVWFLIGIAFIGVGVVLQQHDDNWRMLPKISYWIGGVIVGFLTIWLLLAQLNLDDNITRWGNNILHKIDPAEQQKEEVKKAPLNNKQQNKKKEKPQTKEVIPNSTERKSRDATHHQKKVGKDKAHASVSKEKKDRRWMFTWKSETDSASYPVNFTKFTSFKVEFSTRWQSAGKIGTTEVSLKRKDCFDCFRGRIMVAAAGDVPFADGRIKMKRQNKSCFTGHFNTRGYPVKVKLYRKGSCCQL